MTRWRIELTRDGAGSLTSVVPEDAPEWVNDLTADLLFRIREAPQAQQITATATGPDEPPIAAAAGRPMTDAEVRQALGGEEPGTEIASGVIPPISEQPGA